MICEPLQRRNTFAFENDKLAEVTARAAPDRFDVLQLELASKYGEPTTKDDPKQVELDKLTKSPCEILSTDIDETTTAAIVVYAWPTCGAAFT